MAGEGLIALPLRVGPFAFAQGDVVFGGWHTPYGDRPTPPVAVVVERLQGRRPGHMLFSRWGRVIGLRSMGGEGSLPLFACKAGSPVPSGPTAPCILGSWDAGDLTAPGYDDHIVVAVPASHAGEVATGTPKRLLGLSHPYLTRMGRWRRVQPSGSCPERTDP